MLSAKVNTRFGTFTTALLMLFTLTTALTALERDVVISVYQGACRDGEFTANLNKAREAVRCALERGSDFLALPETFLSGYNSRENVERGARNLDDPELQAFIAESGRHSMVVLAGLARSTPEGIYNSVLVIHKGGLLGIYDKVMLTGGDRDNLGFLPGKDVPVFEANGARFAVVICHDTSFPHPALLARLRGAEILFTPHYNSINAERADDHRRWVRNCHVGLACQLKVAVARSNVVVTSSPGSVGFGDCFILSPQGDPLAEGELFRTEIVTATLKPEMFRMPYVWSSLNEVPDWLNRAVGGMMIEETGN